MALDPEVKEALDDGFARIGLMLRAETEARMKADRHILNSLIGLGDLEGIRRVVLQKGSDPSIRNNILCGCEGGGEGGGEGGEPPPDPPPADIIIQIFQPVEGVITVTDQNGNNVPDGTTIPNDGSVTLTFAWAANGSEFEFVIWQESLNLETSNPFSMNINKYYSGVFKVAADVAPVINITNAAQMVSLANAINTNSVVGGIDGTDGGAGKIYKLINNISVNSGLQPIGTPANPFRGAFDGDWKQLMLGSNFYLYTAQDYVGIFGVTSKAVIKNVRLNDTYYANLDNTVASNYYGGICALAKNETIITNCRLQNISILGNINVFGGICGKLEGGSQINNCNILGSGFGQNPGTSTLLAENGGGIVGEIYLSDPEKITKISNCWSSAYLSGFDVVGGIAGLVYNPSVATDRLIISNCLNISQSLYMQNQNSVYVGKLWGRLQVGNVENRFTSIGNLSNTGTTTYDGVPFQGGPKDGTNITKAEMVADPTVGGRFTPERGFVLPSSGLTNHIAGQLQSNVLPNWVV